MKKTILALAIFTFMTGIILTSRSNSAQKVDKAQLNVIEANKKLDDANKEYLADMENYRRETTNKFAANDQSITEFKARIEHDKKAAKAAYNKKLADLERKNSEMKKKMDDYKAKGKDNWEKFKTEFNHEMDELDKAFKDLTVKKVK